LGRTEEAKECFERAFDREEKKMMVRGNAKREVYDISELF
jgi:hypothetical protein